MDKPLEFVVAEETEPTVQTIGPFRGDVYKLVVNSCQVPYVYLLRDQSDQYHQGFEWYLVLDDRFGLFIKDDDELMRWGMVFANAMAIAAGYTYHGPDSRPRNRFNCRVIGLSAQEYDEIGQ